MPRRTVHWHELSKTPTLVSEYRALVQEPASKTSLDASVALVGKIANVDLDRSGLVPEIDAALAKLESEEREHAVIRRQLRADIEEFVREGFESRAASRALKKLSLAEQRRAAVAALALSIPVYFLNREEHGDERPANADFLLDACLVVFHQLYFALPLESLGAGGEAILHWAQRFAALLPAADEERIRGMLLDARGEPVAASVHYRRAAVETDGGSHEFLTVVQTAWSHLVEHAQYADALTFLEKMARRIEREADYEELMEMVRMTFDHQRRPAA